jgi:hypothetical protein
METGEIVAIKSPMMTSSLLYFPAGAVLEIVGKRANGLLDLRDDEGDEITGVDPQKVVEARIAQKGLFTA